MRLCCKEFLKHAAAFKTVTVLSYFMLHTAYISVSQTAHKQQRVPGWLSVMQAADVEGRHLRAFGDSDIWWASWKGLKEAP